MDREDSHIEFLNGLPKEQPFKVPETYFETLGERVQQRVSRQPVKPEKGRDVIRMLKPVLWLAAGFVMVFLLVHYPLKMSLPDGPGETELAEIETVFSNEWLYDENLYYLSAEEMGPDTVDNEAVAEFLSAEVSEYEIYSVMYN
ncbi:MAG: hypothetical protein RBS73_04740 [Prolixibacteraceae bacterium]|jgi:hypothetical protein|nr:hypothetical protein [Prolixibacteraceae bacterium]